MLLALTLAAVMGMDECRVSSCIENLSSDPTPPYGVSYLYFGECDDDECCGPKEVLTIIANEDPVWDIVVVMFLETYDCDGQRISGEQIYGDVVPAVDGEVWERFLLPALPCCHTQRIRAAYVDPVTGQLTAMPTQYWRRCSEEGCIY